MEEGTEYDIIIAKICEKLIYSEEAICDSDRKSI